MHPLHINIFLTATALAATPSSFVEWVSEFPTCAWPCLDKFYDNDISNKCGPNAKFSTSSSDVQCICTVDNTMQMKGQLANELTTCLSSKCAESRDTSGFEQAVGDSMLYNKKKHSGNQC